MVGVDLCVDPIPRVYMERGKSDSIPGILCIMTSIIVILPSLLDIIYYMCYDLLKDKTMSENQLGNRLKVARAERDLSQDELARLVGVTRQTISSIETGQYCPSTLLAFLLSKKLEKRVDELFFLKGEQS